MVVLVQASFILSSCSCLYAHKISSQRVAGKHAFDRLNVLVSLVKILNSFQEYQVPTAIFRAQ